MQPTDFGRENQLCYRWVLLASGLANRFVLTVAKLKAGTVTFLGLGVAAE